MERGGEKDHWGDGGNFLHHVREEARAGTLESCYDSYEVMAFGSRMPVCGYMRMKQEWSSYLSISTLSDICVPWLFARLYDKCL